MRILIATDGSEFSKAAIDEYCRLIARPESDEILVVSAYEDPYPMAVEPFVAAPDYYQQMVESVQKVTAGHVDEAKDLIESKFPGQRLNLRTEILRGAPDQQIIIRAEEWKADLIVVGSHGRGFWGRLLGSVSDGVVHHAKCSVLVVRK